METYTMIGAKTIWLNKWNVFTEIFLYFYPNNTLHLTMNGLSVLVKTHDASSVETYTLSALNQPFRLSDMIASDFGLS